LFIYKQASPEPGMLRESGRWFITSSWTMWGLVVANSAPLTPVRHFRTYGCLAGRIWDKRAWAAEANGCHWQPDAMMVHAMGLLRKGGWFPNYILI